MPSRVDLQNLISFYFRQRGVTFDFSDPIHKELFKRLSRDGAALLRMAGGKYETVMQKMLEVKEWAESRKLDWSLQTVIKRWLADNSPKKSPFFSWGADLYPMAMRYGRWRVNIDGEWKEYSGQEKYIVWK